MTTNIADAKIVLTPEKPGLMSFPGVTVESARTASELLQRNNAENHAFFNPRGFHNHIVHALLASYDFGATPATLNSIYAREKQYQRPRPQVEEKVLIDLSDESTWDKYLGDNDHYADFLEFFQKEMGEIGWQEMLNKRVFARTEMADNVLARFFAGLYHPVIHIGYGLEFGLPGLIPEGLAQAAGVKAWSTEFLLKSEKGAEAMGSGSGKALRTLLGEIRNDQKIRSIGYGGDHGGIFASLLVNAQDDIILYAKQYRVPIDQLAEKVVESINISALILGGSVRKDKEIKLDFFLMHSLTTSIFLTTFMSQTWITPENKARLLEWKGRFDLLAYAAVGAPQLLVDEIENYVPKFSQAGVGNPWLDIIERGIHKEDDGHTIKTIRALANGERLTARYRDVAEKLELPIVGDMWRKIAVMCIDSVENGSPMWIRGCGFDESWEAFGPRKVNPRQNL